MSLFTRRQFVKAASWVTALPFLDRYHALAAPDKGKIKIRDVRVMMLQGARTYTLCKVEADAGVYGIGEAYGSPGVGVKEQVLALKPDLLGKDPLEIDV